MVRAGLVALAALGLAGASGCSLTLDFSPSAIPIDAAPYAPNECEFGEPNNAPEEATMLELTDVGPAAICAGPAGSPDDRDFYRFTVPAGTTSVTVRVTFLSSIGDLDLRITDLTGGTVLGQSRGFGDSEAVVCPASSPVCNALPPGDYLFEVFGATPGTVNRYELALTRTPM
jgi:hypothetical protein